MDETAAIRMATAIVSVGVVITALEDWKNRKEFTDNGLMSWPVAELEWSAPRSEVLRQVQHSIYSFETFLVLIWLRIFGGIALVITCLILDTPVALFSAVLLGALVIRLLRSGYGADGADQMYIVVLSGLLLASFFPKGDPGQLISLLFIAAQLTLSYVVAGVAKAFGRSWWDGSGIIGVLSTYGYGWPRVSQFLHRYRWLGLLISWTVILFETTFWISWLLPENGAIIYLFFGILFHVGTSIVMGLNNFLFAFLAAYPIIWYCMNKI